MPLSSFSPCPYCQAGIELSRQRGLFVCPVCNCEFRHNFRKWYVGIPLVVVFAVVLRWMLHLPGLTVAFLATLSTALTIARMPTYIVVTAGKDVTAEERLQVRSPQKESRWFLILLISLVTVILTILIWSVWSSLRK